MEILLLCVARIQQNPVFLAIIMVQTQGEHVLPFFLFRVGQGFTVYDCIKRWKTLRDRFVRELKITKKVSGGVEQ